MTVSSETRRVQATGNGVTTAYNFNFEIFDEDDLSVYVGTTLKTIVTHYTVSGVGNNNGGTVTFVTAPANGAIVTLASNMPIERTSTFGTGGAFKASTVNDEFDRLVAMINEIDGNLGRTVRLPITDGNITVELPVAADRASKFMSFDADGNIVAQTSVGEWQGNWAASTAYEKNDIVRDSSTQSIYIALVDHTSTSSLSADVTSEYMALVLDGDIVVDATAQADLAQRWATDDALVTGNDSVADYSSKEYAIGTNVPAGSSKDWATSTSVVASGLKGAKGYADDASTYATAAGVSETNASNSAGSAATSETNAGNSESAAATSETNAGNSATAAAASASDASDSADEAAASAAAAAASSAAIDGKAITDTDADTTVETERTADCDKIYLRTNGVDQITVQSTGVTITNDLEIGGNLDVQGTTTTISSANLVVTDTIIELANGQASGSLDAGIVIDRGSDTNVAIIWDESEDRFSLQYTIGDGSSISPINDSGPASLEVDDIIVNGTITVQSGDILPSASSVIQNIGSASDPWTNAYITELHGTASQARYADLAERFVADKEMDIGDLVEIGGEAEITHTQFEGTSKVFGVISDKPAYLMNAKLVGDLVYPVALTGRVPVRVLGQATKGQALIASKIPGVAIAVEEWDVSEGMCVLGRALKSKESEEIGLLEAAIGKM